MNFVTALKCGTTPEVVAKRCMYQLLNRSNEQGEICPLLITEFINELFKAIGLQTNLTAEQIQAGNGFDWETTGYRIYIFHYNAIYFRAFERFLMQLCATVLEEQDECHHYETLEAMPVKRLLYLLAVWCNSYTDLLSLDVGTQRQYLQEPLARINYKLFVGLHEIRIKYASTFRQLDEICTRLFDSALDGLLYKECHDNIAQGLMQLVEKHFGLCDAFSKDSLRFFYCAFCVDQQKATYCNLFKCLTRILNKFATLKDTDTYRNFLNFLIQNNMQKIYFTTLKLEKTKRVSLAALQFLSTLQAQFLDLTCFSQAFLEAIISFVFHTDQSISQMAAELFLCMAKRKAETNEILLKYIIEYYFIEMNTIDALPIYINAFWPNFRYMRSMQIYFDLIQIEHAPTAIRNFMAHFAVAIYKKMLEHAERYASEIKLVFKTLPTLLSLLRQHQCLQGILLQLYSLTDLKVLRECCGATTNELLIDFENYFITLFKSVDNLQYTFLLNLFVEFERFVDETQTCYKLEMCALYVYEEYMKIERNMQQALDAGELPSREQSIAYTNILQKLCVLLVPSYNILDNLERVVQMLSKHITRQPPLLKEIAMKYHIFTDVYAIEALVIGCIHLSTSKDLTRSAQESLAAQIRYLESYLLDVLSKMGEEVKTNEQIYRLKTYFICLVRLYSSSYSILNAAATTTNDFYKLPQKAYHILIEVLVASCLRRKPITTTPTPKTKEIRLKQRFVSAAEHKQLQLHPNNIMQYQKFMFRLFIQLHASKYIKLPSPAAWKLCLHYGLHTHKFNNELRLLMATLNLHHYQLFPKISAVLVHNLYKQKPPLKMDHIQYVIRAQKAFIDQLPTNYAPNLLCANVVLQVLQFLQESLEKTPPNSGSNRLLALKHLNQFTRNLNVNEWNVLPDIQAQAHALKQHQLNSGEQASLDAYLSDLSGYTTTRRRERAKDNGKEKEVEGVNEKKRRKEEEKEKEREKEKEKEEEGVNEKKRRKEEEKEKEKEETETEIEETEKEREKEKEEEGINEKERRKKE